MKYIATKTATFGPGARLLLSNEQAAPRLHALKALASGLYETTSPVQFKAGESIGVQGAVPKSLQAVLDSGDKPAKPRKPGKQAEI